jgi:hypothetical protein
MDEHQILSQIAALMEREHELRGRLQRGELSTDQEHQQLSALEGALDQCWDLLRQRRARREFGQGADDVEVRSVQQVENYLQ